MQVVGTVESLWRYPVKSMRGEQLQRAFTAFSGIYGDRLFAFHSSGAPKGFPFLTAREKEEMLQYRPVFRNPEQASEPPNRAEAEAMPPGATPVYPEPGSLLVDVETPTGDKLAIDDPEIIARLRDGLNTRHELTLLRSNRAMTDCRPISLISLQTVKQLSEECRTSLDKRRFRANIYLDLHPGNGSTEDSFVGGMLQIGEKALIAIVDRDPRCKIITLDPDTSEQNPEVMQRVARQHDGKAGVYGAVLVEGTIRPGDPVTLRD